MKNKENELGLTRAETGGFCSQQERNMLKSEEYINCNACHICDGELYEGWRVGCEDLVFRSGAEEALAVKEEEVRKKALQSYCLDSCLLHDVNNREIILSCCNEECPIVANFIKNLDDLILTEK